MYQINTMHWWVFLLDILVAGIFFTSSYNLQIRQNDRLAVSKLVTSLTRGTVRSPLAQCQLVRYASQVCPLFRHRSNVLSSRHYLTDNTSGRLFVSQLITSKLEKGHFMIILKAVFAIRLKWWFWRPQEQLLSLVVWQTVNWLLQLLSSSFS